MQGIIEQIQSNKNSNGGGLASNITGKLESNRHAIARMTKVTFGEAAAELRKKRNGGLKITANELLEIYRELFGEPEWHHAGKLPKQYGGGMKKTYFLQEVPSADQVVEWQIKYNECLSEKKKADEVKKKRIEEKQKFANKYGTSFCRLNEVPKFGVIEESEMKGKFGWFPVNHTYNLPIYYSGFYFKSKKTLTKYLNI